MAENRNNDNNAVTVVNVATPDSVVGVQCGGSIVGSTVTVGSTTDQYPSGRWIDPEDIDHSRIDELNDY